MKCEWKRLFIKDPEDDKYATEWLSPKRYGYCWVRRKPRDYYEKIFITECLKWVVPKDYAASKAYPTKTLQPDLHCSKGERVELYLNDTAGVILFKIRRYYGITMNRYATRGEKVYLLLVAFLISILSSLVYVWVYFIYLIYWAIRFIGFLLKSDAKIVGPTYVSFRTWNFIRRFGPLTRIILHYSVYRPYTWSYLSLVAPLKLRIFFLNWEGKSGLYTTVLTSLVILFLVLLTSLTLKASIGITLLVVRDTWTTWLAFISKQNDPFAHRVQGLSHSNATQLANLVIVLRSPSGKIIFRQGSPLVYSPYQPRGFRLYNRSIFKAQFRHITYYSMPDSILFVVRKRLNFIMLMLSVLWFIVFSCL